jgi:hypothetical protein
MREHGPGLRASGVEFAPSRPAFRVKAGKNSEACLVVRLHGTVAAVSNQGFYPELTNTRTARAAIYAERTCARCHRFDEVVQLAVRQ